MTVMNDLDRFHLFGDVIDCLPQLGARAAYAVFAHRDFLRILAVRWVGLSAIEAQHFLLTTASLSILGYDHGLDQPVICLWNDDRHLADIDPIP
jgi:broad specificity phosphatase PhoE